MTPPLVSLPHPLFLILPERLLEKARQDYAGLPFPESITMVEQELLAELENGVLALVDERQPDSLKVIFCVPQFELVCVLTQEQDAYQVLRLSPVSLRTHNLLARGALCVVPQTWGIFTDLAELNRHLYGGKKAGRGALDTGVEQIVKAWKGRNLRAAGQVRPEEQALSTERNTFISNVATLVDLARELELERAAREERFRVRSVLPAQGEESAEGILRLQLESAARFRKGERLRLGTGAEGGELDVVALESSGNTIRVRLVRRQESEQEQRVQWLARIVSTRQFSIQHEALDALRQGTALNPHLLDVIVDHHYAVMPQTAARPVNSGLNPAQQDMLEKALVVPDLLLAWGPPGTGKTETIRQIAAREASLGRRVLITSRNNKAVDNVLEGLAGVEALRIGREEVVTAEVRPLLIDQRAATMRGEILSRTAPILAGLESLSLQQENIEKSSRQLELLIEDWVEAQKSISLEGAKVTQWQKESYRRVQPLLERHLNQYHTLGLGLKKRIRGAERRRRTLDSLEGWSRLPLLGVFAVAWGSQLLREWQELEKEIRADARQMAVLQETIYQTWQSYQQYVSAGEEALQRKGMIVERQAVVRNIEMSAADEREKLIGYCRNMPGAPLLRMSTPVELKASLMEWQAWAAIARRRLELLLGWREALEQRPEMLYPPLVRGAEVVGATCIGLETDARFEDLDFDLAIADEAGQIQVMDLLVPLVRARRAVLVGDHQQLPPVVEPELLERIRAKEAENQELGQWLEKSLFERLITKAATPAERRVMLDMQYRMPVEIADFISKQFYEGRYRTAQPSLPVVGLPLDDAPLIFVDTRKELRHFEQRAADGQGYFNPLESRLICDVLQAYLLGHVQVGVIVPYQAQAEAIRAELRRRQPGLGAEVLQGLAATVDSFQGRELDVVLFGFTRSNGDGRIGFLSELRRLNVSLTRARRQLILIGDSLTLSEAGDEDFARLFTALLDAVKKNPGGYFYANELAGRLGS